MLRSPPLPAPGVMGRGGERQPRRPRPLPPPAGTATSAPGLGGPRAAPGGGERSRRASPPPVPWGWVLGCGDPPGLGGLGAVGGTAVLCCAGMRPSALREGMCFAAPMEVVALVMELWQEHTGRMGAKEKGANLKRVTLLRRVPVVAAEAAGGSHSSPATHPISSYPTSASNSHPHLQITRTRPHCFLLRRGKPFDIPSC